VLRLGGADLIIVYSTGLSRIKGFPTTLIPDSNNVTLGMYDEIQNVVKDTPIIAGIDATEPPAGRDLAELVKRFTAKGFSGVINFPTVGMVSDEAITRMLFEGKDPQYVKKAGGMMQELKERVAGGLDFSREVEVIRICRNMNVFTMAYVFNPEEARAMAKAGVDCMVTHVGGTGGGMTGFAARSYEEAAAKAQEMIEATKEVNPDIICIAHGGPFAAPEDTRYLYEHTDAVGFVGASSIERIPVEKAIKGVLEEFKSIPLK
jgi:predicted TIM-barrel enzyme